MGMVSHEPDIKPGLGLKAVEARKQREAEELKEKREKVLLEKVNQASRQKLEDARALEECEEQALCDSETNDQVKYESALLVRIALRFGASVAWSKISEARLRGSSIPVVPTHVLRLVHPDKCLLVEASDATAILNQQRPPEINNLGSAGVTLGSKEAVEARVAAKHAANNGQASPNDEDVARRIRLAERLAKAKLQVDGGEKSAAPQQQVHTTAAKTHPQRTAQSGTPSVVNPPPAATSAATSSATAETGTTPADRQSTLGAKQTLQADISDAKVSYYTPNAAVGTATSSMASPSVPDVTPEFRTSAPSTSTYSASQVATNKLGINEKKNLLGPTQIFRPPEREGDTSNDGVLRKVDPADDQVCTFSELKAKYSGKYSEQQIQAYWDQARQPKSSSSVMRSRRF